MKARPARIAMAAIVMAGSLTAAGWLLTNDSQPVQLSTVSHTFKTPTTTESVSTEQLLDPSTVIALNNKAIADDTANFSQQEPEAVDHEVAVLINNAAASDVSKPEVDSPLPDFSAMDLSPREQTILADLGADKFEDVLAERVEETPGHQSDEAHDEHYALHVGPEDVQGLDEFSPDEPFFETPVEAAQAESNEDISGVSFESGAKQATVSNFAGPFINSQTQPSGALDGIIVYTSAGHGLTAGTSSWFTQRGITNGMVEDMGNLDQLNFFANYCFNAGATVVPMRPVGYQKNEVVMDNDDSGVTFSGSWNNSGSTLFYGSPGDVPYRWTSVSASETATARYTPNIPEAGYYPIYTWARWGTDRVEQLYRIVHSGGTSEVRVNHKRVGSGFVWLGSYYFEAGTGGYVEISNQFNGTGVVIADTIRFGNGMGDVDRGFGTTGSERELEASRYWVQRSIGVGGPTSVYDVSGLSDQSDNVGTPPRMAANMNNSGDGTFYDRIYLGFHSNAGGARGAMGLGANGDMPTHQQEYATMTNDELEGDVEAFDEGVEFAQDWIDTSTDFYAGITYGEIRNAVLNGEMTGTIIEVAFHDDAEDAKLMKDARVRNVMARASYQAIVKFLNQYGGNVNVNILPDPPTHVRVKNNGNGSVTLNWQAATVGDAATGYTIVRSTNGYGFGNPVSTTGTSLNISGLTAGTTYYFRVVATNAGGSSMSSETVAARVSSSGASNILYVNGYDRMDRFTTPDRFFGYNLNGNVAMVRPLQINSFDYVVQHGKAITNAGRYFDSCSNEAVESGAVNLANYDVVVWGAGQQGEVNADGAEPEHVSFNSTLQTKIQSYLNGGGSLFVSGSEIAWDLDRDANQSDANSLFVQNYLKCDYVDDDVYSGVSNPPNTASGSAGSIFAGLSNVAFDNGNDGTYFVDFPDVINTSGGSSIAMTYTGSSEGTVNAAIQYDGSFKVVYMGFPFETIISSSHRNTVMANALDFLETTQDTTPPAAPSGLVANAGDSTVSLDWNNNGEGDLDGYNVYRSTTSGGPYSKLNGALLSSSAYTDNSVTNNTTYYYVVTAVDTNSNESSNSSQASATPQDTTPPAAPSGLVANAGDGSVSLDWNNNGESDLDGYNVYRSTTSGGPYSKLNGSLLASSAYTDNSASNFTTYYYVVTAVDTSSNESANSSQASATPEDTTPPAAPSGLVATANQNSIGLDWNNNGEGDLDGYHVYRSTTSGGPYSKLNGSLLGSSAYTDSTASVGVTYYYVVTAVDNTPNANESSNSSQASATISADFRLQAEDYDTGGEGVGYHDTTAGNSGGAYRSDDVDIEASSQGGYNVGWIANGEWLKFSNVAGNGGSYKLTASVAALSATGAFHVEVNGVDATGLITFPATGGYQTWTEIDCGTVALNNGSNTIRIVIEADSFNVDYIDFDSVSQEPGIIDFDNYTVSSYAGGQDVDSGSWRKLDNGAILNLYGNTWKRITLNYNVTADTVIEFQYKSDTGEPEIGGIGFDSDDTLSPDQTWQVFGTQAWGIDVNDYVFTDNGWKTYKIHVGAVLTAGTYSYLLLANDNDIGGATNAYFRNVKVYERSFTVVDNDGGAPAYTETGTWSTSGSSGYNGGSYRWSNAGAASTSTWNISVPDGLSGIDVIFRASTNRTTSTRYTIQHADGTATVFVDQTQNNLTWVNLGTYRFEGGTAVVTLDASASTGGAAVISDAARAW